MRKVYFFLVLLFSLNTAFSQYLGVSGAWYPSMSADHITDAGLNYDSKLVLQSQSNQTLLSLSSGGIIKNNKYTSWQIQVAKYDINWNPSFKLEIRRTSDGTDTKLSKVSGGTFFQEINSFNDTFFNGSGDFSSINIQYQLSGFSVLTPVDNYATSVVFTIIEL